MKEKKHILLVEDEAIIALNQKNDLEKYGYSVQLVINGQEAVDTVLDKKNKIDLILMDIDLGSGMDGPEAAVNILEKVDIPILFLSSHTSPDIVEKTEEITSYGYVVKNSGITVLDASIKMAFKLFDAKTELKKQEEYYKAMIQAIHEDIIVIDRNYTIIDINNPAKRFIGDSKENIIGKKCHEISHGILNPCDQNGEKCYLQQVFETGKHCNYQHEHISADGTLIIVDILMSPMKGKDGKVQYVIESARDISDLIEND